jgi:hypothetical protein
MLRIFSVLSLTVTLCLAALAASTLIADRPFQLISYGHYQGKPLVTKLRLVLESAQEIRRAQPQSGNLRVDLTLFFEETLKRELAKIEQLEKENPYLAVELYPASLRANLGRVLGAYNVLYRTNIALNYSMFTEKISDEKVFAASQAINRVLMELELRYFSLFPDKIANYQLQANVLYSLRLIYNIELDLYVAFSDSKKRQLVSGFIDQVKPHLQRITALQETDVRSYGNAIDAFYERVLVTRQAVRVKRVLEDVPLPDIGDIEGVDKAKDVVANVQVGYEIFLSIWRYQIPSLLKVLRSGQNTEGAGHE